MGANTEQNQQVGFPIEGVRGVGNSWEMHSRRPRTRDPSSFGVVAFVSYPIYHELRIRGT